MKTIIEITVPDYELRDDHTELLVNDLQEQVRSWIHANEDFDYCPEEDRDVQVAIRVVDE